MNLDHQDFFLTVDEVVTAPYFQNIIHSEVFYFDKLKAWFNEYEQFDLAPIEHDLRSFFLENKELWNDFKFQKALEIADSSEPLKRFFSLIGLMVAVFDETGYNARIWNPYEDKRRVARANLLQSKWTYGFIVYKLDGLNYTALTEGNYNTFKNAVDYIRQPDQRLNMTSNRHRRDVYHYFFPDQEGITDAQIINLFAAYTAPLHNPLNAGVLTTSLLYDERLKRLWKSEVVGLMAADRTEWQDGFIKECAVYDFGIIWNSGTPSGTNDTIKALRQKLNEDGSFCLFYKSRDWVHYMAKVVDFAVDDQQLKEKAWQREHEIYAYQEDFANYTDENKSAKIVFLTTGLKKLKPIPLNLFKLYGGYQSPVQHNLSPLQHIPEEMIQRNLILNTNTPMNSAVNLILYGPPGTGKTYQTIDEAIRLVDPEFIPTGTTKAELRAALRDRYRVLQEAGHICFTTFHQSYTYEDFIEGIKPLPPLTGKPVQYDVLPGIFKNLVRKATSAWEGSRHRNIPDFEKAFEALKADLVSQPDMKLETRTPGYPFTIGSISDTTIFPVNSGGVTSITLSINTLREIYYERRKFRTDGAGVYYPGVVEKLKTYTSFLLNGSPLRGYVIIIDEINRGNISQIFGELITLIEPSKRLGESEELTLNLPYSKESFALPPNLHIIGTMNTADRSVEALDTALRRRFNFKEMMPEVKQVEELQQAIGDLNFTGAELLQKLNQRIITLKDREHQIGHAYLIGVVSVAGLMNVFKDKIIPLLQEYFFGDYEKIQMVLGKGFVKKTALTQNIFAAHESEADLNYHDTDFYHLRSDAFADENSFKAALKDLKVS